MAKTNGEFYSNRDSRYDDFVRTMRKDGIPVKTYREVNWKQWVHDQWERITNLGKN